MLSLVLQELENRLERLAASTKLRLQAQQSDLIVKKDGQICWHYLEYDPVLPD